MLYRKLVHRLQWVLYTIRFFSIVGLSFGLILVAPSNSSAQVAITQATVTLDTSAVPVPDKLVSAIIAALETKPLDVLVGSQYAITAARLEGNWALVSIAVLDGPSSVEEYVGSGESGSLIIASQSSDGSWVAALQGTSSFPDILNNAPEDFLSPEVKTALTGQLGLADIAATVEYKFPWAVNSSWQLTPFRNPMWHDIFPASNIGGLDFLAPFGATPEGRRVLAATDGIVTNICTGDISINVFIQDDNGIKVGYAHIDKNNFNGSILGKRVPRGYVLGTLLPGEWNDNRCQSYTRQNAQTSHLHWILPTNRALVVDGWTIQYNNNFLQKGTTQSGPGTYFTSTNPPATQLPPPPAAEGIIVKDINEPNVERDNDPAGLFDAPAGSITSNNHATWTYSNNRSIENSVKWKPPLDKCGRWEVYAYIARVNNNKADTTNARYNIRYRGGEAVRIVNQDAENIRLGSNSDRWVSLGTYVWSANAHTVGEFVFLGDTTGVNGQTIIFDDMRWLYRGPDDAACYQSERGGFEVVSQNSNKCLDVAGVSPDNGANVHQWDCVGGANQRWSLNWVGDGFELRALHTNKCLDVAGVSPDTGANVHQWDCVGGANQRWQIIPHSDGVVELKALHSNKCLDVAGVSRDNGANVHQWDCWGGTNQRWFLRPVGTFEVIPVHSGKCLDVSGVSPDNGANVLQWDCLGGANQRWRTTVLSNSIIELRASHSNKCLDVSGVSPDNGANVHQWECVGGHNQRWRLNWMGDGFELRAIHSNKCLDVAGVSRDTGANVHQWECVGGANQRWRLRTP